MSKDKPSPIRHILLLISCDGHKKSLRKIAESLAEIGCDERPGDWPTDLKHKFYDWPFDKDHQEEWLGHLFILKRDEIEIGPEVEPVAYIHKIDAEGNFSLKLSFSDTNPLGIAGKNYSDTYKVTTRPLYFKSSAESDCLMIEDEYSLDSEWL